MFFERYNFICRFESAAELPFYKGSTFRGVFGRALKKVVCALKQKECNACLLNATCIYSGIFENQAFTNKKNPRMAAPPRPFVIEPPLTTQTRFPEGSAFEFSLVLMGRATQYLPYFIYAFEQMGVIGIGKKINHRRGRFLLEQVRNHDQVIYSSKDQKLTQSGKVQNLDISLSQDHPDKDLCLGVTLETPLRLKFNNRLHADLPFHLLVRAMLRRISSLMDAYGSGEPPLDYPGLVKKAGAVETIEQNLSWFDWQRYSFRQDQKMLMGGMTGSVTYQGAIKEYLPLVEFCEKVHLGKQTVFGLGKIKAEVLS